MQETEKATIEELEYRVPPILPILPLRKIVLFPAMVLPIAVEKEHHIKLIEDALNKDKLIGVFLSKVPENPSAVDIEEYGTMGSIIRMIKVPDGSIRVLAQGLKRIRIQSIIREEPYISARVEKVEDAPISAEEIEPVKNKLLNIFKEFVDYSPYLPDEITTVALNIDDISNLADFISGNLKIDLAARQELLQIRDVKERYEKLINILSDDLARAKVQGEISGKVQKELTESQRKAILREQMREIKKELGEEDPVAILVKEYKEKIKKAKMTEEAAETAKSELERMEMIPPHSPDYNVIRNYLDWLCDLPWQKKTKDNMDIKKAEKILDEDHHDLQDVKERIIEFLSVRKLKKDAKGPIICLVGPPGVGKTSIGQSIARALDRKFTRLSLGGVHDEAEIRGHRRTYIGALPGRIIQHIRRLKTKNPIFMLDEVDKIGKDFRGDPASALLEVLDPEQNNTFRDNFLEVAFDLSSIMFITTANITDTIPPPLLDRMEIIRMPGYTAPDKFKIATRYLVPRRIKENGLNKKQIEFTAGAINKIINNYTREAGVRNLEREIGKVCRKVARMVAKEEGKSFKIDEKSLEDYLGPIRYRGEAKEEEASVGVSTGLAWTPAGGTIHFVEATIMEGKGELLLTGQLGEVLKESARAALSYIKSNASIFNIKSEKFANKDIHIHIPEGAIPKDGPSAGITLSVALISIFSEKPVSPDFGMTGEITLRGKVLPIGGVKEKVLAAKMAGIKNIILPRDNEKDLAEIPDEYKKGLKIHFVERIEEAVRLAIPSLKIKNKK
jgi:ATP-dependent Lon protease